MKIVIDISEDSYKATCNGHMLPLDVENVVQGIKNGVPLEQLRDEIERLHYHPKLDFIKNDEVVGMALDVIDKYR